MGELGSRSRLAGRAVPASSEGDSSARVVSRLSRTRALARDRLARRACRVPRGRARLRDHVRELPPGDRRHDARAARNQRRGASFARVGALRRRGLQRALRPVPLDHHRAGDRRRQGLHELGSSCERKVVRRVPHGAGGAGLGERRAGARPSGNPRRPSRRTRTIPRYAIRLVSSALGPTIQTSLNPRLVAHSPWASMNAATTRGKACEAARTAPRTNVVSARCAGVASFGSLCSMDLLTSCTAS